MAEKTQEVKNIQEVFNQAYEGPESTWCTVENGRVVKLNNHSKRVKDLKPLAELSELRELELGTNLEDVDLTPLAACTKLERLKLYGCGVKDISPLSSLTSLKSLELNYNKITNVGPLKDLVQLVDLSINNNSIKNIKPLKNLNALEVLDLSNNKIEDIEALQGKNNLTKLRISSNKLTDLSALESLANIKVLSLSYNEIENISPIGNNLKLTSLDIERNKIVDISCLSKLVDMQVLNMSYNQIVEVSSLSALVHLKELQMSSGKIVDIKALAGHTELDYLNAANNLIEDISPVQDLLLLRKIYLGNNKISNLSPLKNHTKLERLHVEENYIADFAPLKGIMGNPLTLKSENQKVEPVSTSGDLYAPIKINVALNKPLAPIVAFNNDSSLKEKLLDAIKATNNKPGAPHLGKTIGDYSLKTVEAEVGLPVYFTEAINEIQAKLQDSIPDWPQHAVEAIKVGADLSKIWAKLCLWIYNDDSFGLKNNIKDAQFAPDMLNLLTISIDGVLQLYKQMAEGQMADKQDWEEALKFIELSANNLGTKSFSESYLEQYDAKKLTNKVLYLAQQLAAMCRIALNARKQYDGALSSSFLATNWGYEETKAWPDRSDYEKAHATAVANKYIELLADAK